MADEKREVHPELDKALPYMTVLDFMSFTGDEFAERAVAFYRDGKGKYPFTIAEFTTELQLRVDEQLAEAKAAKVKEREENPPKPFSVDEWFSSSE